MPSDLPLMSTGFATYPVPPHSGQLSGSIAPLMWLDFQRPFAESCNKLVHVTNHEQNSGQPRKPVLLNRASPQSKKSLIPGLPNDARSERVVLLKTITHQ